MKKILESIKNAEKGSDIYHLIEKVAERISKECPGRKDEDNWFDAQERINAFLLEDKLAEKISTEHPDRSYESCMEEAREILNKISLDEESVEEIMHYGINIENIISCNLKYYSNQFYLHRKNKKDLSSIEQTFEDWKKALECVADNISLY